MRSITVPNLGVNDTSATVRDLLVVSGAPIERGSPLCLLETTKVSIELEAEADGYVAWCVKIGDVVNLHQAIGVVASTADEARVQVEKLSAPTSALARVITAPARALMERHGLREIDLPDDAVKIIRESDVRRALEAMNVFAEPVAENPPQVRRIAIFNAQSGGRTVAATAIASGYDVVCFVDDVKAGGECDGRPILSTEAFLSDRSDVEAIYVHLRKDNKRPFVARFREAGLRAPAIIHPTAVVDPSVVVSEGVLVKAGAVIDAFAVLRSHVLVDNGVVVPHNVSIGSYTHVAPGVSMGGDVRIGTGCVIGVGATIAPELEIGDDAVVLPGATIRKHVPAGVIVDTGDRIVGTARKKTQ